MSEKKRPRLTEEQRAEITRRVLAGEKARELSEEFGVTRAYVALLKAQALDPERFERKREVKLARKLTEQELEKFKEVLASSTPEDHDLIPTSERWSLDHGSQLAMKLFNKRLSVRALKEWVGPHVPKRSEFRFTRPKPPKPHHINQLDPELAKDEDFVKYYLSPICEQIAWREYEMALADWEERFADSEERELAGEAGEPGELEDPQPMGDFRPADYGAPGKRFGKHAKSKGLPFTPKKKRRKKR